MKSRAWQRMISGRRLDLLNPSPLDVELADLVLGLSRVPRWNGQTIGEHAFSVAQHALLVEAILQARMPEAPGSLRLLALLHDGSEYVIGDLISPFKAAIGGDYKSIEENLLAAIFQRFGLSAQPGQRNWAVIKKQDSAAAYMEARALAGFSSEEADKIFSRPSDYENLMQKCGDWLQPLPPGEAAKKLREKVEALEQ